jgi:hypothetical protein
MLPGRRREYTIRVNLIPLPVYATHGEVRRVSNLVLLGGPDGKMPKPT